MTEHRASFEIFAEDVFARLISWMEAGEPCALARITDTEGGGVRSPDALMAISQSGKSAGYISGGCIDADIIKQAQSVIETGAPSVLRYGNGTPFFDLPLPCGGSIGIEIIPIEKLVPMKDALFKLANRQITSIAWREVCLQANDEKSTYQPRLRLRIAGRGADCLALAKLGQVGGYEVELLLPDQDDIDKAQALGFSKIQHLKTRDQLPKIQDDAHTAFVLMFHDRHWEVALLKQALAGHAFYIGAVGSVRTHEKRCMDLRDADCSQTDIARIRAPIGLLPARREASSLAVSVMAEILNAQNSAPKAHPSQSGAILLAAGASTRFEYGDKLLHPLGQSCVVKETARSLNSIHFASKLAVIDAGNDARAEALQSANWPIIENARASQGQSTSLKLALQAMAANPTIETILIVLGDMPFVPKEHIEALYNAMTPDVSSVMTEVDGTLMPPALFSRACLTQLMQIDGDRGAGQVFRSLSNTKAVALDPMHARDIDTISDLTEMEHQNG